MEIIKKRCEHCGSITSEREIALYRGLVIALWRVYKWAEQKNVHEFSRKDIKHLFVNENDTARFGDWVMFGGLVYKLKKAKYGLNMERCDKFFKDQYAIPTKIYKNPITGELRQEDIRTMRQIPTIMTMLNADGEYVARYREPIIQTLI